VLFATLKEPTATWLHWIASDLAGIVSVAPLVIGIAAALRRPPARREAIESLVALAVLGVMSGVVVSLPLELWNTVVPAALVFPILLWLAARSQPVFSAAGAFIVSMSVALTAIYGLGHFGDSGLSIGARVLQTQAIILGVTIGTAVLAALFAERREAESRLIRTNMVLERERNNRLMSLEAMAASIAHEMKQPLTAIAGNSAAVIALLQQASPDLDEIREAERDISTDAHRAGHVLDGIRALFQKIDHGRQPIDMNAIVVEVLQSLHGELSEHGVRIRTDLSSDLPLVEGNANQLHQVIYNLVHNAVEAMHATTAQERALRLATARVAPAAISVTVQDSGPGIDPKKLDGIFDAFVTTKRHGMGLGLAICRVIAERHGGELTASPEGKNGALFQMVLPVAT
jgi:signal transduction histidine kinase